jgi:hypothetical protein
MAAATRGRERPNYPFGAVTTARNAHLVAHQNGGCARVVPGQGRLCSVDEMLRIYDPIAD